MFQFTPTARPSRSLRLAIAGPAGSGKTYSALTVATGLGQKVAVIDTERGSASLCGDAFNFDGCRLSNCAPEAYVGALHDAQRAGYGVIVIDSLSHAWAGRGGVLEGVDLAISSGKSKDVAWREASVAHAQLLEAIAACPAHIIVTLRAKAVPPAPGDSDLRGAAGWLSGWEVIQKEGIDYEFDITGMMTRDHRLFVSKSRFEEIPAGEMIRPDAEWAAGIWAAVEAGVPPLPPEPEKPPQAQVESVPAAPHSASSRVEADRARAKIAAATSMAELDAVLPVVQKLPEADKAAVTTLWVQRRDALMRPQPRGRGGQATSP